MKQKNNYLNKKISWFVLSLFGLLSIGIVGFFSAQVGWGSSGENIFGWAWSPLITGPHNGIYSGYGLTSFNDCYCVYGDPPGSAIFCGGPSSGSQCLSDQGFAPYGLTANLQTKEIYGWAWSSGVGWICFGNSCANSAYPQTPSTTDFSAGRPAPADNPHLRITYDDSQSPSPLTGWAKIINFPENKGWLSLRGNVGSNNEYGLNFATSTMEISGLAWNGFLDGNLGLGMANNHGYGWFCIGVASSTYGTDLCADTMVKIHVPFLQTTDGVVYARDNINFDYPPDVGSYNATYLVLSGGSIANFTSEQKYRTQVPTEQQVDNYVRENYPYSADLPRADRNYRSELGFLDMSGLLVTSTNAYGTWGGEIPLFAKNNSHTTEANRIEYCALLDDSFVVTGKRMVVNGDLTLGNIEFGNAYNGVTVIVKGDLRIAHNITVKYAGGAVTDFADLPSISFIVEGDMFIDPLVENLAGNFVVLGDSSHPDCPTDADWQNANGCGAIYTGGVNNGASNDICDTADYVFNTNLVITGNNCSSNDYSSDSELISLPIGSDGRYYVYAQGEYDVDPVDDGEWYKMRINGSDFGLEVKDNPCGVATSTHYTGMFDFHSGNNTVYIKSTFTCAGVDDPSPASVHLKKLCLSKSGRQAKSLTSYGIMMARRFFLQRKYSGALGVPAEHIIYDGRMLVNPPPGFKDLAKSLPIFAPIAPK